MKKVVFILMMSFVLVSFTNDSKVKKSSAYWGIDISEYQPNVDWKKIKKSNQRIKFVILRATMGDDRKDDRFSRITQARAAGFTVGAYHYYDPNENSEQQARNYISRVRLKKGDFIPIVDLEVLSRIQSTEKLKAGLKKWLDIVERHYGAKPMLYTGYSFYAINLAKDFSAYPLWVAAYSAKKKGSKIVRSCEILQYSKQERIPGIKGRVDGDIITKGKFNKLIL